MREIGLLEESASVNPGNVSLSCAEPLVLKAIIQAMQGPTSLIATLKRALQMTKTLLGDQDTGKGTIFQHLTTARLLQRCARNEDHKAATLGELLQEWGVDPSDPTLPTWVLPRWNSPVELNRVFKDHDGTCLVRLLGGDLSGAVLVEPNEARVEYVLLLGGVLTTAGCKFYGANKKFNRIALDNEWTTNISNLYCTDKGPVNKDWEAERKIADTALEVFWKQPNAPQGTLRLCFCLEKNFEAQLVRTWKKLARGSQTHEDLVLTFTRTTIDKFFPDAQIRSLLESYYD